MPEFVTRPYQIYSLPLPVAVLLHPEQAILRIDGQKTVDFGSLCYSRRSTERRSRRAIARKVDPTSLNPKRILEIRRTVETLSHAINTGRRATWYKKYVNFVRFVEWCDENRHEDVLVGETQCRLAMKAFVGEMWRLVNQHELSLGAASLYQDHVISMLELVLGIEDLGRGINRLRRDERLTQSAQVPDDAEQSKQLAWFLALFTGLSDLVLDPQPYPFALTVPAYLEWPNNRLWLFPVKQWFLLPTEEAPHHTDYRNGRIRSLEEVEALYSYPYVAKREIKRATSAIDKANKQIHHFSRLEKGMLAMKAFIMLFHAVTGINPSQAADIRLDDVLRESIDNPQVERQNFRTIKYRAGGSIVTFQIGVSFMPYLRRYIKLREYLLRGEKSEWLFFSFGIYLEKSAQRIQPGSAEGTLRRHFSRLDPALKIVVPREWRAAKLDFATRGFDPITSAAAGQHSLSTALKKYNNGSEVRHQVEMGAFFEGMERKIVLKKDEKIAGSEDTAIGACSSPQKPSPIAGNLPVEPNCKDPEGCLFCDKYRAHVDEPDASKLLSARFCINAISHLAANMEEFEAMFGRILTRIDDILNDMKRHDAELVEKIRSQVTKGRLHRYWAGKIETLMELELI